MLVDVHCHLTHAAFKDNLNEVLQRAKKNGIAAIITSGVNVPTNREVLELTKKYKDIVKCSLGLYPIDLLGLQSDESGLSRQTEKFDLDQELEFIKKHKDECVAIGECGMDFHVDKDFHDQQKKNFQKIIEFAEKINKPIVIHSRKAEIECFEMLESSKLKKVQLHMFEGRKHIIKKAADKGYFFSIPTNLHKSQHFQMMVDLVNINQLFTETDAPWVSPVIGTINEPANVAETVKHIAKIKKMDVKEVESNIFMNYQQFFL